MILTNNEYFFWKLPGKKLSRYKLQRFILLVQLINKLKKKITFQLFNVRLYLLFGFCCSLGR